MGGIQTPPPQLDLAKFCPEAARQNLAKSSRAFQARNYLNYRGSIWPNFGAASGQNLARARISHRIRRAARFGQFCPEAARQNLAKSSRDSFSCRAFRKARLDLAKFCPEAARQNLAKSSRAFLISFDEQPDLAKFCPQTARQNLAKSSRAFLEARNYLNYRGSIWPNFAGKSAGKIWPNRAARRTR